MASGITVRKNFAKLDAIIRMTPEKADRMLAGAAVEITSDIILSFGTSPSPPGGPPGVDTGNLRASMTWESEGKLRKVVYTSAEYAPYLEFGTERMAARPFFSPVFEDWRQREFMQFVKDFGLI